MKIKKNKQKLDNYLLALALIHNYKSFLEFQTPKLKEMLSDPKFKDDKEDILEVLEMYNSDYAYIEHIIDTSDYIVTFSDAKNSVDVYMK